MLALTYKKAIEKFLLRKVFYTLLVSLNILEIIVAVKFDLVSIVMISDLRTRKASTSS